MSLSKTIMQTVANSCPIPQMPSSGRALLRIGATFALIAAAAIGQVGCGGGSSPAPAPAPIVQPPAPNVPAPPPPDPLTPAPAVAGELATATFAVNTEDVGGTGGDSGSGGDAGDGAPIKRAVIVVTDRTGQTRTGTTNDNGSYFVRFPSAFQAPIVVKVIDAGGNVLASASNEAPGANKVLRINLNPLTDKMVSDSLAAAVRGTDKPFQGSDVDVAKLAAAKTAVVSSIQSSLAVTGITKTDAFDPVASVYKLDGTGVDAVLESINHSRNPNTGATELRAKLAGTAHDALGVVQTVLITPSTPLGTSQVAISTNPTLTFNKVNAWINEINRCLGLVATAFVTDPTCGNVTGNRLVASNYKQDSRDFLEDFRTLFSETPVGSSGPLYVQGSTFRNPNLLLLTKSSAGAAFDDVAVLEVTIRQPRIGPLATAVATPVEYTKVLVFHRDDALNQAIAGNWVLGGNQRNYQAGVFTRYVRRAQTNPAMQANLSGQSPSRVETRLHIDFPTRVFSTASRGYVDNGVRAIRVKGPGLPPAGVVYQRSSVPGVTWLAISNKTGVIPAANTTTPISDTSFGLAASLLDGTALFNGFWNANSQLQLDAPLTDFASLSAFARYSFEVFNNSNTAATVADASFSALNLGNVQAPAAAGAIVMNDVSPNAVFVTAPQPALPAASAAAPAAAYAVSWVNNPNAAPVTHVRVFGQERSPRSALTGPVRFIDRGNNVVGAGALNARPSSQSVALPEGLFELQNLNSGDFRQVSIWANQARSVIENRVLWNNPAFTSGGAVTVSYPASTTVGQTVAFSVQGTPLNFANGQTASFANFSMDFGDGSPSVSNSSGVFSKVYSLPGLYTATVVASTAEGARATSVRVVGVQAAIVTPIPYFLAQPNAATRYSFSAIGITANSSVQIAEPTFQSATGFTRTISVVPHTLSAQPGPLGERTVTFLVASDGVQRGRFGYLCSSSMLDASCALLGNRVENAGSPQPLPTILSSAATAVVNRGENLTLTFDYLGTFVQADDVQSSSSIAGPFISLGANGVGSRWDPRVDSQQTNRLQWIVRVSPTAPTGPRFFRVCHNGTPNQLCTAPIAQPTTIQ